MRKTLAVVGAVLGIAGTFWGASRPKNHTVFAELPPLTAIAVPAEKEPLSLKPCAMFNTERVKECSGLEKSVRYADTIWTVSDSGSAPVVFALRESGDVVIPAAARKKYAGIRVTGTRNLDWECVALDEKGNLIIGDVGNNLSNRRNLCFYIVPEPNPARDVVTPPRKKISFYYPSQNEFPAVSRNYDCESCFALNGQIYFFTKHWSDTETVLWRVDPSVETYQAAVPVSRFDANGMVTDAALSPSRKRLAVLTYHCVWVFELPGRGGNGKIDEAKFFTHSPAKFRRLAPPKEQWQLEGIAFIGEDVLLIASEQGGFFRVSVSDL
ncbi:MAG: hypothetical protein J6L64_06200 [Opitutales bacterium]|nr:hypothetical protein [Opitutales bacterium]